MFWNRTFTFEAYKIKSVKQRISVDHVRQYCSGKLFSSFSLSSMNCMYEFSQLHCSLRIKLWQPLSFKKISYNPMPEEGCQKSHFVNLSPSWVCTSESQEETDSLQKTASVGLTLVWHVWRPGCCLGHPWLSCGAFLQQHKLVCPVTGLAGGCHQCPISTLCDQTVEVMCPGHCCRHCLSSAEKPAGQPGQSLHLWHLASQSSAVHPGWVFPCGLLPAPFLFCCESFLCPPHCVCGSVSRDVLWQWYWRESKSNTWCRRAKKPTLHTVTDTEHVSGWRRRVSAPALLCQGNGWGRSRAEHTNPMQSGEH